MRKTIKKTLISFLLICILLPLISCTSHLSNQTQQIEQDQFDSYLDELFGVLASSDSLSLNYTLAKPEDYGILIESPTLGEFTLDAMAGSLDIEKSYLNRLLTFDYDLLTEDQQLTYDIIKNNFELDVQYEGLSLYAEVLGPTTGLQAQLPILLAEYNFYSREDITNYLALLKDVRRYFSQICDFEHIKSEAGLFMSDEVATNIIDQCCAFISDPEDNYLIEYFNEKIEAFSGLTESEKNAYKDLNAENIEQYVIPAYKDLISTLNELKGTGTNTLGLCYYPEGKRYYEYLVAAKTGSSHSIEEIADLIDQALIDSLQDMSNTIHNDPTIFNKLSTYEYIETEPEQILTYLKTAILKDFPSPPAVTCEIKYVHASLQDYVSPAMYLIPALDNYDQNIIYINNNPKYDMSEIFTTIAHEGYPGHLYQCVYFRSQDHHPIRNVFGCLGYDEGWATYAELYSYQIAGLDPDVASILMDNMVATHCIYSRTDIGIHYEGWTYSDVRSFLNQFIDEDSCKDIYQTLLEEPAIYLPYCVGYLEITQLRDDAMAALGKNFELKAFHQFLLDLGPTDFEIIHRNYKNWLKEQS